MKLEGEAEGEGEGKCECEADAEGEGKEGEERRLKLDHPNIRQWAKENEDAGVLSGEYRKDGKDVPENPYEKEYIKGTDPKLWYVAQEIKTLATIKLTEALIISKAGNS